MTEPKLRFSVIVPAFNAESTITPCLEAILASEFRNFELLVVDDASTDKTAETASRLPCRLIRHPDRRGPAAARVTGKEHALGETLVFIDSDILIQNDTLQRVADIFVRQPQIAACTGILSASHPNRNFFSVWKNHYLNETHRQCPNEADFIYGSFFAVRKEDFRFRLNIKRYVEDTELGLRMIQSGLKIAHEKDLQVIHLKKYSFFSLLKNDFLVPFFWTRLFIQFGGLSNVLRKRRFCHAGAAQLSAVAASFLSVPALGLMPPLGGVLILASVLFSMNFHLRTYSKFGPAFTVKSIVFTWLDQLVMAAGILLGFIVHLRRAPLWRRLVRNPA